MKIHFFLRVTESACWLHEPDKLRYFVGSINVKRSTLEHQKKIIVLKNSRNSFCIKRHSGKHRKYCFKIALIQEKNIIYVQELLIIMCRKKKSTNWVISHLSQSNLKKHKNIKIEEILSLYFWDSGWLENINFLLDDDTNSNLISYVLFRIKIRTWSFQKETNPV